MRRRAKRAETAETEITGATDLLFSRGAEKQRPLRCSAPFSNKKRPAFSVISVPVVSATIVAASSVLGERIIGKAIQPSLTRLRRRDDRMRRRARVLRRVPVRRRVAAQRDAARLTGAQVHPGGMDLHALVALPRLRVLDRRDLLNVPAGSLAHGVSLAGPTRAGRLDGRPLELGPVPAAERRAGVVGGCKELGQRVLGRRRRSDRLGRTG